MLIPHLHFDGNCAEAIALYEKAFDTKADGEAFDYAPGGRIAHAAMKIHGCEVFLNDALKFISDYYGGINPFAHLIVTFDTTEKLLACYEILKAEGGSFPFRETKYSRLVGNFVDKFGVLWGFMAAPE